MLKNYDNGWDVRDSECLPGSGASGAARERPRWASSPSDMMAEARAEYDAEQTMADAEDDPVAANDVVRLRNRTARETGAPNA